MWVTNIHIFVATVEYRIRKIVLIIYQVTSNPNCLCLMQEDAAIQGRPKLMLTRPKEPELQTSHRVRAVKMKSSAELEEEMLAKIPKFRARPFNKKVRFCLHQRLLSVFNCLLTNYMMFFALRLLKPLHSLHFQGKRHMSPNSMCVFYHREKFMNEILHSLVNSFVPLHQLQEFHLKTMERATRYADTCSEISSADSILVS